MPKIIYRAIKYRIYPDDCQRSLLSQTFGCVRKVYNMGLELQKGMYASGMKPMSNFELNAYCNHVWKSEMPYLRDVDKFALTNSIIDLGKAYKSFFEKHSGYPKFKSEKHNKKSYTTNYTNGNIALETVSRNKGRIKGRIKLPKLGWIEANIHRHPEEDWTLKNATVSQNAAGKYFVSVLFEFSVEVKEVAPTTERTIGLDYSSPHFYVDSEGRSPQVPHAYRKAEKKLAREQRRLSKMVYGSKNYEAQRILVAKLQEHAANQRKDFCHKLSRKITNSYNVVCVEDMDLRALSRSLSFGKATLDNGFGMFRTFLQYKLEQEGKHFVVVDKWYPSTKTCHHCGTHNPDIHLGQNEWVCPSCGRTINRDYNAALNIRDEGFRTLTEKEKIAA